MTSVVGYTPKFEAGEGPPAWAVMDWNNKVQHDIYRDWGTYYLSRRRENLALHYFSEALRIDGEDWSTLYRRSLNKAKAAEIPGAIADARAAAAMTLDKFGHNCPINLQICDGLFELNQFENSSYELSLNLRRFIGVKAKNFHKRRLLLEDVIKDVTGKALSLFYLKNQKLVERANAIHKANEAIDDRPMWKILRDMEKCDVLSIPDEEVVLLSPLEHARRKRAFNVIHQTYLNKSWNDVLFMKEVRKNPNLLLEHCKYSYESLKHLSKNQYDVVFRFIKMIYCRSPLYLVNFLKFSNKTLFDKHKEAYLFRIQYQVHRNMITHLKEIRRLRKENKIKRLSQFVEQIMGDYYVVKTNRVMCWRFEFYNEVYNSLALCLTEQYRIPKKFRVAKSSLWQILKLPIDYIKEIPLFVFGDRSTYQDGDIQDPEAVKARKTISRLEKRIKFSKYSIEKCYLYHQIAGVHLSQLHYDECCFSARKAIKECQNCNSVIWKFLSVLQIVKANEMQHKVEKTKEAVEEAVPIAVQLKSPQLIKFMEVCVYFVEEQFFRKNISVAGSRQSKASVYTLSH